MGRWKHNVCLSKKHFQN